VEQLLGARDAAGAIHACQDLLSSALATASTLLGDAPHPPRDPALLITLLGLDGKRYMAFRAAATGGRAKRESTIREALQCYAFALEARASVDRVSKGG
jgi:hypothetical protein